MAQILKMTTPNVVKDVEQLECLVSDNVKCEKATLGNSLEFLLKR